MKSITIAIPDERLQQLQEIAARFQLDPEALVRASIEELLALPEPEFNRSLEHVLTKNAELYRRLA